MSSNKSKNKNRKRARQAKVGEVRPRILIVTEGTKSEVDYFNRLRASFNIPRTRVLIFSSKWSDPTHVLNRAVSFLLENDFEVETVFFVFDRDQHKTYKKAIQTIRSLRRQSRLKCKNLCIATSVPCFEFWYMLHVSDFRRSFGMEGSPCRKLEVELRKFSPFQNYEKNSAEKFFDTISVNRRKAVERSKSILNVAKVNNEEEYNEDPSTRIHLIVEEFERLAQSLNR